MKQVKKSLSSIFCGVLVVALALSATGCNGKTEKEAPAQKESQAAGQTGNTVLGQGETQFMFSVVDLDGKETQFEIHTDKETVGEALLELELISGDESEFGLYVKTVNNITADYDKDGAYWAFYVNGEYAQAGVDSTAITEGEDYSFKMEKA